MPKTSIVRRQGRVQQAITAHGGTNRGRGGRPPGRRVSDVHVPPFVATLENTQDSRKYSWTLLKCWSKRMYAAFEAHIKAEYLEYSRKSLAKKFYTTIHGHKRSGIRTDDSEFQIFEIKNIGKLECIKKDGTNKLQIETTEIRCANNMESNQEIAKWILISHSELADVLHDSLKIGDYLAVWGAKYQYQSKSAFLNSFGNIPVPETVLAIYRHENSLGPVENLDPLNVPFQERNISHYLIQEGESGICDIVEEIYPKPKTNNGSDLQYESEEESSTEEEKELEHNKNDNDIESNDETAKSPRASPGRNKPSTSAEAKNMTNQSPTTNKETPTQRKSRSLSNNGILRELEKRGHSGGDSDSSIEIVEEFHDSEVTMKKKGASKRNKSLNVPKSKTNVKSKKNSDIVSSDQEASASDSDSSFEPNLSKKSKRKRGRRASTSSDDSLISSAKKPARPRRAAKNSKARHLSESSDASLTSPRPTRSARNSQIGRRPSASPASISISKRPSRAAAAKITEVSIFEESGNEDESLEPPSKTEKKLVSRSPNKTQTSARDKSSSNADKSRESESLPFSQTSIVLELDTQRFGVSGSQSKPKSKAKGSNNDDDDSDWSPPADEKGASGSEKENEESDTKNKSQSSDSGSDSDEESLETKRQKLEGMRVKRKLFTENGEEESKCSAVSTISTGSPIPSKWTGIVKPCRVKVSRRLREMADKYVQSSSGTDTTATGSKKHRK